MPTAPMYGGQRATLAPFPNVRATAQATPETFGYGTGKVIEDFGEKLADIERRKAEQARLQADQGVLLEARRGINDWEKENLYGENGAIHKHGKDAFPLPEQLKESFDAYVGEKRNTLANDRQRQHFDALVQSRRESTQQWVQRHVAVEYENFNGAEYKANIASSKDRASMDPATAPLELQIQRDVVLQRMQSIGAGPDVTEQELQRVRTGTHAAVIEHMIVGGAVTNAKGWLDANEKAMDPDVVVRLRAHIQPVADRAKGQEAAADVWSTLGPKGPADQVRALDMEDALRSRYKGDDAAIEFGIKGLRERAQAFKSQRDENSNALEASVNKLVLNGASSQQLRNSPQFIALSANDPKAARAIDTFLENKQYTAILRANASETRQQQVLARRGMGAYLDYSNPDRLNAMSENQIINLLPTLGNELTSHLMTQKRALGKTADKLVEARIDTEDFSHIASEIGLRPYDPSKTEDEKAALGELKYNIEQRINAAQQALKRPLNRDEKMTLMRSAMDDKVMKRNRVFADESVPAVLLPKSAQADAYVNVGTEKVKLSSIPPQFRADAITQRRAMGLPVDEATIAKLWVKNRAKPRAEALR